MFYVTEKPTNFTGRSLYEIKSTLSPSEVVASTLDETAALAVAWAMNNTSDLKDVLQGCRHGILDAPHIAVNFPDELREALHKER